MSKVVRQVVWSELLESGDVMIMMTCGHITRRAAPMAATICDMCPVPLGDDAPLMMWQRVRFVELGDGA